MELTIVGYPLAPGPQVVISLRIPRIATGILQEDPPFIPRAFIISKARESRILGQLFLKRDL